MDPRPFFDFCFNRHRIALLRSEGLPPPWTSDPILRTYKFTNVFREMDRTTRELRLRTDPIRDTPEVLLQIVALRWFNRTTTWRSLEQVALDRLAVAGRNSTPSWAEIMMSVVGLFSDSHSRSIAHQGLLRVGGPPWVTGAYIIQTETGTDKLSGVVRSIGRFANGAWCSQAEEMLSKRGQTSLESMWRWMLQFDRMGPFMAYEVVTDMRHTDLLCDAPDIMTWANAGPGAMRGLNRLYGRRLDLSRSDTKLWCTEMQEILACSLDESMWPQSDPRFPAMEMRDVEHSLCEFDKYERVRLGQGEPRGKFRPSAEPMP